ncbi:protein-tyrosine phosphatase-like protein [Exophiala viscosa]|uniref:protein-tyrosine phosphatase-like protein n=1 Tax=Exophiala viscosa TaxID=2486360 RepID=UPI00219C28AC|nr:protein-tyrosine phosphatase-like protein [Exophiala viscosa]
MEKLKNSSLDPIKAVPGLCISDRVAASSPPELRSQNIRRILSVLQPHDILKPTTLAYDDNDVECSGGPAQIQFKSILIDDDPTIDILQHLGTACDWIQDGLQPMSKDGAEPPRGVLVHCRQGNSRSGAFVVAYTLSLVICPNDCFEKQLRVWEHCRYDIYLEVEEDAGSEGRRERKEKPAHKAWKARRDDLLTRGEGDVNRARDSSLANAAAALGRCRLEDLEIQAAE